MYEIGSIRVCSRCESEYQHYGQKQSRYRECRREYDRNYHSNRSESVKRELKSENGCVDCGVTDYRVLQFDHLPEHEKAISIADGLRNGYSKSKLKEEMAKCEIVCANCHSIRTFERRKRT